MASELDQPEKQTQPQNPIKQYLTEDQDPKLTQQAYSQVMHILTTGEKILYVAVQKPLIKSLSPDCVVLECKQI